MRRAIIEFRQDDAGAWAARLSCLHGQHIRHNPPFQVAAWVLDEGARHARIGSDLECPLCDRAELPGDVEVAGQADGGATSTPAGTWGLLAVDEGTVRIAVPTAGLDVEVGPGEPQPIPPEVDYQVQPAPGARWHIDLLRRR